MDQTTPVLEYSFPRVDEGEKEKGRKESEVNRARYPNDGIYTGRLHGDDLQPNRPICLRYAAFLRTCVVKSTIFDKLSFRDGISADKLNLWFWKINRNLTRDDLRDVT